MSETNDFEEVTPQDVTEESKDEWVDLLGSGAIMKKVIRKGEPDTKPQRFQQCVINYFCMLEDESIVQMEDNFELQLGDCDVVQGLDVAISLMDVKEKCILKIQPRLAFGEKGLPPKVPPNAAVLYNVELLEVKNEVDVDTLSIPERKAMGNKKRERGNWWYGRGENNLAIQCYRRALDYLEEVEGKEDVSDSELQSLLEDRVSVCNNMAAAQIKMELYDAALLSLQKVLHSQPDNVKALFRKAKVLKAKNDLPMALKCLTKANNLSPNDSEIQKQISLINALMQKQKSTERELARRMFSNSVSQQKLNNKENSSIFKLWFTVGLTIAVGVAGAVAYRFKFA